MNCDYSTNKNEKNKLISLINMILEQNSFTLTTSSANKMKVLQWELPLPPH
jgi:hypothetical protein